MSFLLFSRKRTKCIVSQDPISVIGDIHGYNFCISILHFRQFYDLLKMIEMIGQPSKNK